MMNEFITGVNQFIQNVNQFIPEVHEFTQNVNEFGSGVNLFIPNLNWFIPTRINSRPAESIHLGTNSIRPAGALVYSTLTLIKIVLG